MNNCHTLDTRLSNPISTVYRLQSNYDRKLGKFSRNKKEF